MAETKTIHEKLVAIQSELKAPKGQTNAFGKYKYRSCEDILESVKPLLKEQGLVLTLTDWIENIGDRFYVRATATVSSGKNADDFIAVSAFAREEEEKKGMDGAQVTGAASSYARKYALNGLFCIDDTKDADTMDNTKPEPKKADVPEALRPSQGQLDEIERLLKETNSDRAALLKFIGLPENVVITPGIAIRMIDALKRKLSKQLDAA